MLHVFYSILCILAGHSLHGPVGFHLDLVSVLQDKVYANAEAQAKLFMEYVHSSKDEADDFDFEGDRQYDGSS